MFAWSPHFSFPAAQPPLPPSFSLSFPLSGREWAGGEGWAGAAEVRRRARRAGAECHLPGSSVALKVSGACNSIGDEGCGGFQRLESCGAREVFLLSGPPRLSAEASAAQPPLPPPPIRASPPPPSVLQAGERRRGWRAQRRGFLPGGDWSATPLWLLM